MTPHDSDGHHQGHLSTRIDELKEAHVDSSASLPQVSVVPSQRLPSMDLNFEVLATKGHNGASPLESPPETQSVSKAPSQDGSSEKSPTSKDIYVVPSPKPGAYMNMSSFEADTQPYIPPEFLRNPTGSSIGDPSSILHQSGRFYHGYKAGKYLIPNDGVSFPPSPW
jgi:hypothetical protein